MTAKYVEQTIRCRVCGEPYVFYSHMAGDQSACPDCRARARERSKPKGRHGWR